MNCVLLRARLRFRQLLAPALLLGGGLLLPAPAAEAAPFAIAFEGTVTGATLELGGLLSGGEAISGTIALDDSVAGNFTPAADPVFLRNETIYPGAVLSAEISLLGDTLSGTGGDVALFDSGGGLAGSDSYEATAALDASALGSVDPVSFLIALEFPFGGFALADGDPLFPPPGLDPTTVNLFTLTSASGGIAFGRIDDFELVPVPEPGSLGMVLVGAGALCLARRRSRLAAAHSR